MDPRDRRSPYPVDRPPFPGGEGGWSYAEAFAPGPEEEEGGVEWARYWAAVLRYKWLIMLTAVLGAGGAYGAWTMINPSYVAQGSLWISGNSGNEDQGPIAVQELLGSRSQMDLLTTFRVLDTVVMEERLYLRPRRPEDLGLFRDFELGTQFLTGSYRLDIAEGGRSATLIRDNVPVETASVGESIGAEMGFRWTLPEEGLGAARVAEFAVVTPRDAAIQLAETLEPSINMDGSFLTLDLRGSNPERIARVLNAVMERHVAVAAELKNGELIERTNALQQQLGEVESQLRAAEQDLEQFRITTITEPSDVTPIQAGLIATSPPAFQIYFQMRAELETTRSEREQVEALLSEVAVGGFALDRVESTPAVGESTELRAAIASLGAARADRRDLGLRYTPEDPRVRQVTSAIAELEGETIPALILEVAERLDAEERRLAARVAAAGQELAQIPPRTSEEGRLTRDVAMRAGLYEDLLNRYETARLAEASTIPDVQILDRATPPEIPANDERIRMALLVFVGALGLGVAGALLLDRVDPRVRYPDEVGRRFGLPFLGVVPAIPKANGRKAEAAAHHAFEAFRELRTNLTYAYGSAGPIVLAITSPGAGDGKSLVSANLALAFAHQGRSTLLIDGDSRRGHLHRSLGLERKPGLTDYLALDPQEQEEDGASNGLVQETEFAHLHVITAGSRLPNSPELLGSGRMAELLAELKGHYEVIVVDTPPLAAGSDAVLLSCLTGHLILVLRSGSTNRDFTQAKIEPIHRLPVRVLGIVLNDYDPRGVGRYAYYGNYLPDYETGQEHHQPLRLSEAHADASDPD